MLPEFLSDRTTPGRVPPEQAEPVPDTPEADALAKVLAELDKIPQPPTMVASGRPDLAGMIRELSLAATAQGQLTGGLIKQMENMSKLLMEQHAAIHALQKRVDALEAATQPIGGNA